MKKSYIKPSVEIAEVNVEKGFALSDIYGFNPSDFEEDTVNNDWWNPYKK